MYHGGELINKCRLAKGLTMRELADRTGFAHATISTAERGIHDPAFRIVEACLAVCGYTLVLKKQETE